MYHRFGALREAARRSFPIEIFATQLDYLSDTCTVIAGEDSLVETPMQGPKLARRPYVIITVDDGYKDFEELAFPQLASRSTPALLFVTSGFVGGADWMWWDKVRWMLASTREQELSLSLAGELITWRIADEHDREGLWSRLVPALRFVPNGIKDRFICDLATQLHVDVPDDPPAEFAPSTWAGVRRMAAAGIAIGAHTRTHSILSRVNSERACDEIMGSRADIEGQLGTSVKWFAYPQGGPADYDDKTLDIVEDAGFNGAYVAYSDPSLEGDLWRRPRYNVGTDFTEFRWMICGAKYIWLKVRRLFRLRTDVSEGYWTGKGLADAIMSEYGAES